MDHTKLHALYHGPPSYIDIKTYIFVYIIQHLLMTKKFLKYTLITKFKPFKFIFFVIHINHLAQLAMIIMTQMTSSKHIFLLFSVFFIEFNIFFLVLNIVNVPKYFALPHPNYLNERYLKYIRYIEKETITKIGIWF
jgi:hypothetical protein